MKQLPVYFFNTDPYPKIANKNFVVMIRFNFIFCFLKFNLILMEFEEIFHC